MKQRAFFSLTYAVDLGQGSGPNRTTESWEEIIKWSLLHHGFYHPEVTIHASEVRPYRLCEGGGHVAPESPFLAAGAPSKPPPTPVDITSLAAVFADARNGTPASVVATLIQVLGLAHDPFAIAAGTEAAKAINSFTEPDVAEA